MDYSLETMAERIIDSRTKKYFEEVARSYHVGNYRSAVVMLWSVIICDLFFKLDQLSNAYGDAVAKAILATIEATRLKDPKSPAWENELVEEVKNKTKLLEPADYANLIAIQQHRHLSAHPVMSAVDVLFSPTPENVRAHIRNGLDGVLTKPAIMTKKAFDSFLEDLETVGPLLPDQPSLKKFIEAKYFPHFVPAVEDSIFRSLWRVTFKSTDARAEKNRNILWRTLLLMYERRKSDFNALISADHAYYSDCHFSGTPIAFLYSFLRDHPPVFGLLTAAAKAPIDTFAKSTQDLFVTAYFLSPSISDHLDAVNAAARGWNPNMVSVPVYHSVVAAATAAGVASKSYDLGATLYATSVNFNQADERFREIVAPYLNSYSADTLTHLLSLVELNNQCYGRGRAASDHALVKARIDAVIGAAFVPATYPHFSASL